MGCFLECHHQEHPPLKGVDRLSFLVEVAEYRGQGLEGLRSCFFLSESMDVDSIHWGSLLSAEGE
jgi:hypothetical protein